MLTVGENGDYSINSKSVKLKNIEANKILTILSHSKRPSSLNYLYEIDNYEFDWAKNGQIKNIRISDYDDQNKVMGKINIPGRDAPLRRDRDGRHGVDAEGRKRALGLWQGSSENTEVCRSFLSDMESRGLALRPDILFFTDGGSGLTRALKDRFGIAF